MTISTETTDSTDLLVSRPALAALSGYDESQRVKRRELAEFIVQHPTYDVSLWIFKQSNPLRRLFQSLVNPSNGDRIFGVRPRRRRKRIFRWLIMLTVAASLVMAIIATPMFRRDFFRKHGSTHLTWFTLAELALMMSFLAEFVIKVVADGFLLCPNVSRRRVMQGLN